MRKKTTHLTNGIRAKAVVGTAGHIDHGKTTLVRTLTGIDTDRLGEEKARGISIELGFAFLPTEEGRVAIIDVPGHERFVRQMIAGAAGIDLVLLVIAADEGVMPQTLEHLDICNLLGVRHGAVVLTKTDLVDSDWLELVKDDVAEQLIGTFLEGCKIIEFSAEVESYKQSATQEILELVDHATADPLGTQSQIDKPFKLSIDRVFSMRGFGTVVTGTTASGSLGIGDAVKLIPQGEVTRVRGIQVHGEAVERVLAGSRAAINLQGIEHQNVSRSEVLTSEFGFVETKSFDGTLTALKRLSKNIKNRAKVLVHVGTAQIQGTLVVLGQDEIAPGEQAFVQVRLDHPTSILPGEPYVIRGFEVLAQYGKTLGGGRALIPSPNPHRKRSQKAVKLLQGLSQEKPCAILLGWLDYNAPNGVLVEELPKLIPLGRNAISETIEELTTSKRAVESGGKLFLERVLEEMKHRTHEVVTAFHQDYPAREAMSLEEVRSRIETEFPAGLTPLCLQALIENATLEQYGDRIKRADHQARLSDHQQKLCSKILEVLRQEDLTPTRIQDLPELLSIETNDFKEAFDLLLESGAIVRITKELAYASANLDSFKERLVDYLKEHESIDTAGLKVLTGASRKWTIPLGEYCDTIRLTVRVGEGRRLRDSR